MSKKMLLAGLLLLSATFSWAKDEKDSTWYYANSLSDYATADLVGLVRVGETKILDTTGGYTVQEVSFEPLRFYKGKTDQRKFRVWLENHNIVWKPGTIHGFYLLKGEPAKQSGQDQEMYYWLENAGFALKDTVLLNAMSDITRFKQMVGQYILPGIGGNWAKVKLEQVTGKRNESYGAITATILLEEEVPALELKKGSRVPVTIWRDAYTRHEDLVARFQKKGTWQVVLYKEKGILNMDTVFMLEP